VLSFTFTAEGLVTGFAGGSKLVENLPPEGRVVQLLMTVATAKRARVWRRRFIEGVFIGASVLALHADLSSNFLATK
jgi:enoyl-CoA hydratase/carnithine racemase